MFLEAILNGANATVVTLPTPIAVIQVKIYQVNNFALVAIFTGSSKYLTDELDSVSGFVRAAIDGQNFHVLAMYLTIKAYCLEGSDAFH